MRNDIIKPISGDIYPRHQQKSREYEEAFMSILNTLTRLAFHYRTRRRRHAAYMEISSLPQLIQRDIGWPDPGTDHGGTRHRHRR